MIETQTTQMVEDFAQRIQSQGITLEQYFQFDRTDCREDDGRYETTGNQEN